MTISKSNRSGDGGTRWLLRFAGALALLVGILVPTAVVIVAASSPASAEVYQCDTQGSGHHFDGTITHTSSVIGTAANIVNRLGAVCDTDRSGGNTSWGWAMLAGNLALRRQYAQTGFVRFYGTPDYFFSQDNRCTGVIDTVLGASPAYGQTHHYWTQWNPFCSCLNELVDVSIFQTTSFDPRLAWTQPFSNQWLGETHYLATDMPGNPSVGYTTFTQMQVELDSSKTWTNTLPALYYQDDNIFRYTHDAVVSHPGLGNVMDIWTYYGY